MWVRAPPSAPIPNVKPTQIYHPYGPGCLHAGSATHLLTKRPDPGRPRGECRSWRQPLKDLRPTGGPEAVVAADAAETGADGNGRRLPARQARAVGPSEGVCARNLVRRPMPAAEEVLQHAAVAQNRAQRTGAALLLDEEGVKGALPAQGGGFVEVGDGG